MISFYYAGFESPIGTIQVKASENGIHSVTFTDTSVTNDLHQPTVLKQCIRELMEYMEGKRQTFSVPLHPSGTQFQLGVWDLLQHIPYGQTLSYLQLSEQLGDPKSVRAVANANGANPIAILIPCHRIIGSDGKLTGYSGGLHRKQWLLDFESKTSGQNWKLF